MANQSNDLKQKKVIDLYEGYHLVLAPPGCGKTHVLAQRVVEAHRRGVDFSKMLCLTFTNRAARNMRNRVEQTVTDSNITELFVGNIHRFCSQYLFENKIIPMNTVILDEWEVSNTVESVIEACKRNWPHGTSGKKYLEEVLIIEILDIAHCIYQIEKKHPSKAYLPYSILPNEFCEALANGESLDARIARLKNDLNSNGHIETVYRAKSQYEDYIFDLMGLSSEEWVEMLEFKLKCAKTYNSYKDTRDLLDFDDLLIIGYEQLKDLNQRNSHLAYSWIQVDEVQDLNPIQLEIINCIIDKENNPCVVYFGDEQQAIYSFMGAAMASLEYLKQKCGGNIHHFDKNYRSPKYLLDLYNKYAINILGVDSDLLPNSVNNESKSDHDIILKGYNSKKDQYRAIRQIVNYYLSISENDMQAEAQCEVKKIDGKVAILAGSNKEADEVSKILSGGDFVRNPITGAPIRDNVTGTLQREFSKISHVKISGRDFFSTPQMKTFLAHFNVVNFEANLLAWSRLLNQYNRFNTYEQYLLEEKTEVVDGRNKKVFVRRCPKCGKTFETQFDTEFFCSNDCLKLCPKAESIIFKMRNLGMTPADIILDRRYLKDFYENYKKGSFVIFDTETTGLNVFKDDIIQIAAIKLEQGEIKETFSVVIHTDKQIPAMLGNVVNPMVEVYENSVKVSRREGLMKFIKFVGNSPILAHNLNYDYNILKQNFIRCNIPGADDFLKLKSFDSLKLIRLIKPKLKVYKLNNLVEQLGLQGHGTHNAEDDIVATKSLTDYCFNECKELISRQDEFLSDSFIIGTLKFLKEQYGDIYQDSMSKLYDNRIGVNHSHSAIVENMIEVYNKLVDRKVIGKSDKFDYFINFLEQDVVELQYGTSLAEQLSRYLMDISTFKEADYCDSKSMKERVFVSTVHKAKGLEFDNVIVLSGVEGVYPFYQYPCRYGYPLWNPHEEDNRTKESARLLYVAISRARKRLCITHYNCNFDECFWGTCSDHCKYYKRFSRFIANGNIRGFFYPYPKDE